jgi:hypothetical protein
MFKRLISGLAAMAMVLSGLMLQPTAAHAIVLLPPSDVSISAVTNNTITVQWTDQSDNEVKFYINISTDGNIYGNPVAVNTMNTSSTGDVLDVTIGGLNPNTQYWAQVIAVDVNNAISPEVNSQPAYTYANAPGAVVASNPTATTVDLSIDRNGNPDPETKYHINTYANNVYTGCVDANGYAVVNNNNGNCAVYLPESTWANVFPVKGLAPSTTYQFEVASYNANGNLYPNNNITLSNEITTGQGPATPKENVSAQVGTTSATLTWEAGANGNETKFIVGHSTDGGNVFLVTEQPVLPQDQLTQCTNEGGQVIPDCFYYTFVFKDLLPNTPHVFSVAAADDNGNFSSTITTPESYTKVFRPDPPILNGATLNSLNITINPTDGNPDDTEYSILETTTNSNVLTNGTLVAGNFRGPVDLWQTAAQWNGKTIGGLTEGTAYEFQVKARNKDNVETHFSDPAKQFTLFPAKPAQVGGGGGGGGFLIPSNNTPNQTKVALVPDPITNVPVVVTEPKANGQVLGEKIALLDELIAKTKYGQTSNTVKQLQTELRNAGFFPRYVRSTGWYGPITRAAVAKYLASIK